MYRFISTYINVNKNEWEQYGSRFMIKSLKKNEVLLYAGQPCNYIYVVKKGLIRVFYTSSEGKEKTFHFSKELELITDYENFLEKKTSNYSLQALEDTEVVLWSHDHHQSGYKLLHEGEKLGRKLAEEYLFLLSKKMESLYMMKPLERYNQLRKEFPDVGLRVSQHYIASFLNITPVHLSRLKRKN